MILLLDTSTPLCRLVLLDGDKRVTESWQADRNLAHGLLKFLKDALTKAGYDWPDLTGIGVFEGPGSFTGLRIGLTVANTLADSLALPIAGARGDDWQEVVVAKLRKGQTDQIVMPFYGADANITAPRK